MSDIIGENTSEIAPPEPICTSAVVIDEPLLKRIHQRQKLYLKVAFIVGAVLLAVYIILSPVGVTLYEDGKFDGWADIKWVADVLLWTGAILFGVGLIFFLTLNANEKSAGQPRRELQYRFYRNCFTVTDFREGEDLGTLKIYYNDLSKARETKEFFLLYPNSATFYPVDKAKLSPEETAELRGFLPLKR